MFQHDLSDLSDSRLLNEIQGKGINEQALRRPFAG
jgi:hypothetical protein